MKSKKREVCFYVEFGGVRHDQYVYFSNDATYGEIQEEYDSWVRSLIRRGDWYFTKGEDEE